MSGCRAGAAGGADIVLSTLNARFIHASLGLRYLQANMARHGSPELAARTVLREFTIQRPLEQVLAELLQAFGPATPGRRGVLGLGIYLWNVQQSTALVRRIKTERPDLCVVLGGPEVSHEWEQQPIVALADYVITGWGDVSFAQLCRALFDGAAPPTKVISGCQPSLEQLALPYDLYTETDLAQRVVYVEASRGCPFRCAFCLSALDRSAWAFPLPALLAALQGLLRRGAGHFKFVDRTFNLNLATCTQLLDFFLRQLPTVPGLRLHFELIPDRLPESLKALIAQFPAGVLQFEVGVQSFNPEVQRLISRRQNHAATCANLAWLVQHSHAHIHADLVFGLPGESWASFAAGFDTLLALGVQEIQLGLLKRLRGAPISRLAPAHALHFDPAPPYAVRSTAAVDAAGVQRFVRLARHWDLLANSGRFAQTLAPLLRPPASSVGSAPVSAFALFADLSDWLWHSGPGTCGRTCGLTPETLTDALFVYLTQVAGHPVEAVRQHLWHDYRRSGARGRPQALRTLPKLPLRPPAAAADAAAQRFARQQRHWPTASGDV